MLEEVPPEQLSLRELARRLGVSLAAPHHHFPHKDELFAAVAQGGFLELGSRMIAAVGRERDPSARLPLLGHAYLAFASAHPMRYRVMYLPQLADRARFAELHQTGERALDLLSASFSLAGATAPRARAVTAWATLHGFAVLTNDDLLSTRDRKLASQVVREAMRTR
ncbi:MAG: Transcriptional regulator, TetR family protein [Myxococcaceae bacterium]|nr:Transcriptional regulator, TetR family protein [Myxococcaceae bacterium]